MDPKPHPTAASGKTPTTSLDSSQEPRAAAAASSAEIRQHVKRATGQVANGAQEAKDQAGDKAPEVKGEIVDAVDDARETGTRLADKVQRSGQKAIEATSALATSAINVAGDKVRQMQGQIDSATRTASGYIHDDPVRAVTYTAIGSAVLTAALIGIVRRR